MRLGQGAAVVCSVASGVGMFYGLVDSHDGIGGYIVPFFASVATTGVIGGLWHGTIKAAARVRDTRGYIGTCLTTAATLAIAIGASSWPVASTISGPAALRAYQHDEAARQAHAEDAAWEQASKEYGVIVAAQDAALSWRALSEAEIRGGISPARGNGPIAAALAAAAQSYEGQAAKMEEMWLTVSRLHAHGSDVFQQQQVAIGKDSAAYAQAAADIRRIISAENALHLTPLVANGGLLNFRTVTTNRSAAERIEASAEPVTAKMRERVKEIEATRREIPVPDYVPLEQRDAVKIYASTTALAGWVCAIAIDCAPVWWVVLLLLTALETHMGDEEDDPPPDIDPNTGKPSDTTHAALSETDTLAR